MFESRKIKFRVWDKENKKMYYAEDYQQDVPNMVDFQGRVYETGTTGRLCDCGCWGEYINLVEPDDRCILMQYTGIKDCNDKEVYEGDIVHVTDSFYGDDKVYKGVVKFAGGYYWIEGRGIRSSPLGWIISSDDIEVVGNVFENPELLVEVYDNA
jgi:uncharacterized phage protein (TIGR01671 family)